MSPIIFIIAKVNVALLPQLKINSLTKRPTVPIINSIKAVR
jgi:hypothetical protein